VPIIFNYLCVWSSIVVQQNLVRFLWAIIGYFWFKARFKNQLIIVDNAQQWLFDLVSTVHNTWRLSYPKCTTKPYRGCCVLKSMLVGLPIFFMLRIIIVDPFFIVSYNLIQKLLFCDEENNEVQMIKQFWITNSDNVKLILPSFWIFPFVNDQKRLIYQHLMFFS